MHANDQADVSLAGALALGSVSTDRLYMPCWNAYPPMDDIRHMGRL